MTGDATERIEGLISNGKVPNISVRRYEHGSLKKAAAEFNLLTSRDQIRLSSTRKRELSVLQQVNFSSSQPQLESKSSPTRRRLATIAQESPKQA